MKKPPIGLRPRWIAEEQRLVEIAAAMARFLEADEPIPQEWNEEAVHYIGQMEHWRSWAKRHPKPRRKINLK